MTVEENGKLDRIIEKLDNITEQLFGGEHIKTEDAVFHRLLRVEGFVGVVKRVFWLLISAGVMAGVAAVFGVI